MSMSLAQAIKTEQELLLPTYDRHKVLFRKGKGVYLYDDKGKKYLDLLSGIGVNALGHAHPAIRRAITQQAGKIIHSSNLFYNEYQPQLAKKLTQLSGMDRAFFSNSGTEAFEAALKLARAYANAHVNGGGAKFKILAMEHSFHGRTYGSVSATHKAKYREPFAPGLPGVEFVHFNDVADLEAKFDAKVCAIALETVQGEGGIRPVTVGFLKRARELSDKHDALLIADEIQCGLGRTGRWFAYQHYGIHPDLVTVAKPLAGGVPLGALLVSNRVAAVIHPGMHGTTFGGGPMACATALAVIGAIERQKLVKHCETQGRYWKSQLDKLAKKHAIIREVRCLGLMMGIELHDADVAKAVVNDLLASGIVINRTDETVLRLLPPFIVEKSHADAFVKALDKSLGANPAGKGQRN